MSWREKRGIKGQNYTHQREEKKRGLWKRGGELGGERTESL